MDLKAFRTLKKCNGMEKNTEFQKSVHGARSCQKQLENRGRFALNFRSQSQCFNGNFAKQNSFKRDKFFGITSIVDTGFSISESRPPEEMASSTEMECKKICVLRCLNTLLFICCIQFLLLAVFLLFVNFNIFHPLSWITGTIGLFFSWYTWIFIFPLFTAIILFGIVLGNSYLNPSKYYPTRFSWIYSTGGRTLVSCSIHVGVGFLTAWLYSRYLSDEYNSFMFECFNGYCLNSRYMFLTWSGIYSGLFYFVKERLSVNPEIKFPIIQESKYVQIRSALYRILYTSLLKSFMPTLCFTLIYWVFGKFISSWIANLFGANDDENLSTLYLIATNIRLVFYTWILSSQILSNMYIMDVLFVVMLTQPIEFSIEKNPMTQTEEVTLVEALSLPRVPIIQQLASLDFFNLANIKNSPRRHQIFTLSFPGGHPYNWSQLSGQCLSMINAYTEELSISLKKISTVKNDDYYKTLKPSATETAEKILLRQYNETYGIRHMMAQSANPCQAPQIQRRSPSNAMNDAFAEISRNVEEIKKAAFRSIPGLFYFWGESEGAKTAYLLSQSQTIIWISQGLAGLCASSLSEDKYGVVQCELPSIIRALLKLKMELDKLNNVNLNGKRVDRNYITLKNAVKRSLYRICTVFSEYIRDLIDDTEELKNLHSFIHYQE